MGNAQFIVGATGLEPVAFSMSRKHSKPTELSARINTFCMKKEIIPGPKQILWLYQSALFFLR